MFADLAEVRSEVLTRLADEDNTIWSNGEIGGYIIDGYDELVARTRALFDQEYINDTINTAVYPLPNDLTEVARVVWNGRTLPPMGMRELQRDDARFNAITGDVDRYVINRDGPNTIRKYRVPAVTATNTKTGDLIDTEVVANTRVEFFRYGADLNNNPFEIPRHWSRKARHYAMWQALDRDGPGQDLKIAKHFKMRWSVALSQLEGQSMMTTKARDVRLGGEPRARPRVRRPRLPWEYGVIVK